MDHNQAIEESPTQPTLTTFSSPSTDTPTKSKKNKKLLILLATTLFLCALLVFAALFSQQDQQLLPTIPENINLLPTSQPDNQPSPIPQAETPSTPATWLKEIQNIKSESQYNPPALPPLLDLNIKL